jgi:hypothetical protein
MYTYLKCIVITCLLSIKFLSLDMFKFISKKSILAIFKNLRKNNIKNKIYALDPLSKVFRFCFQHTSSFCTFIFHEDVCVRFIKILLKLIPNSKKTMRCFIKVMYISCARSVMTIKNKIKITVESCKLN